MDLLLRGVSKDVSEIYSRLFDHHAFLSGEINFFVKEFEGRRHDNDVEGMFQILDRVIDVRETQVDKAMSCAEPYLGEINENLSESLLRCDKILEMENIEKDTKAAERRLQRQKDWEKFEQDLAEKEQQVMKTFADKEQQLRDYYKELEQKLHITE